MRPYGGLEPHEYVQDHEREQPAERGRYHKPQQNPKFQAHESLLVLCRNMPRRPLKGVSLLTQTGALAINYATSECSESPCIRILPFQVRDARRIARFHRRS